MSKPLSLRPDYPGYSGGAAVPRGEEDANETMSSRVAASYLNQNPTFRSASDERSPHTKRATMTNVLNGLRKSKVVNLVNHLIDPHTKGFFRDEYWTPVAAIRKELDRNGIEYTALPGTGTYTHNQDGKPISKSWKYEIEFVNDRGNLDAVYLHITASGAGSVADPMGVYDVVAYAN